LEHVIALGHAAAVALADRDMSNLLLFLGNVGEVLDRGVLFSTMGKPD